MKLQLKCKKSKVDTKYLCIVLINDNDKESFITSEFGIIKKSLNLSPYAKIDGTYLKDIEFDSVLKEWNIEVVQ